MTSSTQLIPTHPASLTTHAPLVDLTALASASNALAEQEEATAERSDLAAAVLQQVIGRVRDSLPQLGSRPLRASDFGSTSRKKSYQHRCIALAGDARGPDYAEWRVAPSDPTQHHDPYAPRVRSHYPVEYLFLRCDGLLVQLSYHLTEDWPGEFESDGWFSHVHVYPDARAAVEDGWWDVQSYVQHIADTMAAAVAPAKKGASKLRAESARLQRALELLRADGGSTDHGVRGVSEASQADANGNPMHLAGDRGSDSELLPPPTRQSHPESTQPAGSSRRKNQAAS